MLDRLPKVQGEYKLDYNCAHLTWFKTGGVADIFYKPLNQEDLRSFLKQNKRKLPVLIIGAGSNTIIRDKGIEGVLIKLGQNFTNIEFDLAKGLIVGAGCLNFNLARFCKENGFKGFEFLIGIPGTVGGGIAMNAGAYNREFKDIVVGLEAIDFDGEIRHFDLTDIGFGYRSNKLPKGLIFTKILFKTEVGDKQEISELMEEINQARNKTQPIKEKTGGSTFANPDGAKAWELIDRAGLRGKKLGGAVISNMHCNFIVNTGDATSSDLENLGELVRQEVKNRLGYELKWEIKRIGRIN